MRFQRGQSLPDIATVVDGQGHGGHYDDGQPGTQRLQELSQGRKIVPAGRLGLAHQRSQANLFAVELFLK